MPSRQPLETDALSFSQAQGYETLPQPLQLEQLTEEARVRMWNLIYQSAVRNQAVGSVITSEWRKILSHLHSRFSLLPHDEFDGWSYLRGQKNPVLYDWPFNTLFDFIEMIMRHPDCPQFFTQEMSRLFIECRLAYAIADQGDPQIVPAATREEGQSVVAAMEQLQQTGLTAAATHLAQSSQCINEGDWLGSVRESIHAVESAARQLNPAAKTLSPALEVLPGLHPALKEAFQKLYGYTSDEQGIRHALLNDAISTQAEMRLCLCLVHVLHLPATSPERAHLGRGDHYPSLPSDSKRIH